MEKQTPKLKKSSKPKTMKPKPTPKPRKTPKAIEFVGPTTLSKPTKGWKEQAPKLISQRRELMRICGPDCFLKPSTMGFPICGKDMNCVKNCSGILSSKQRARQWKYDDVAKNASDIWERECRLQHPKRL